MAKGLISKGNIRSRTAKPGTFKTPNGRTARVVASPRLAEAGRSRGKC